MVASIAVVIASVGRPEVLGVHVARLKAQTRPPDRIVLSVPSEADLPTTSGVLLGVDRLIAPKGLCAQRNAALDAIGQEYELVAFLDDDYLPSLFAIERIVAFFDAHPEIAGANGTLLADGANGPGISAGEAIELLDDHDRGPAPPHDVIRTLHGLYGCNMVLRGSAIEGMRFDDRLKLYGWQEDIDFSARALARGQLVKTSAFTGVHLAEKRGRIAGVRLGYSQVINPVYLAAKGTMRRSYAARIIAKSLVANHFRALHPEPWVDRLGRIRGNWLGVMDCLRGRLTPERIEAL